MGAKVEGGRQVDNHGSGVRKLVKRFGRNQHAAQRFDGKIDAYHLRDRSSPCSGTVDDRARGNRIAGGRDFEARVVMSNVVRDSSYARVLPDRGAVLAGPGHEADRGAARIDKSVG